MPNAPAGRAGWSVLGQAAALKRKKPMLKSTPIIYLRDTFSIRPGLVGQFFEGQTNLLTALAGTGVTLLAACGTRRLIRGAPFPEVLPPMMHIWRLPKWDTLYNLMYAFSETDWYSREVSSLKIEHQDLLIKVGPGIELTQRPSQWPEPDGGYVYLYDEIRLNVATTKMQHLRDLNWFQAIVENKFGWRLTWIASEVTGTPGQLCLLWRAPSVETIERTISWMAYNEDETVRDRYSYMMAGIETLTRQYLYPESTEDIDNQISKPAHASKPGHATRRAELMPQALAALRGVIVR
jgi:hypothetical protein